MAVTCGGDGSAGGGIEFKPVGTPRDMIDGGEVRGMERDYDCDYDEEDDRCRWIGRMKQLNSHSASWSRGVCTSCTIRRIN